MEKKVCDSMDGTVGAFIYAIVGAAIALTVAGAMYPGALASFFNLTLWGLPAGSTLGPLIQQAVPAVSLVVLILGFLGLAGLKG